VREVWRRLHLAETDQGVPLRVLLTARISIRRRMDDPETGGNRMIRLRHAATAAAMMTLAVTGCANTEPASPPFIVTDQSTTTMAPDLSWLIVTTTAPPVVVPEVVRDTGTPVDGCFMDLAAAVGWPPETLATLARVIHRESRCDPSAFADRPSTLDNSRGLLQINAWGTLADNIRAKCGVEPDALFDPATNLACGLVYWRASGWRPWGGA
jgi:hypothetical protein